MARKLSRKTRSMKAIKYYVSRGYKTNEIQRRLIKRNLGVRRKNLLKEIRILRMIPEPKDREKYFPKKPHRGKITPVKITKYNVLYRACVVMNNIPVSSRPFNRNYLGMRICGFSFDSDFLSNQIGRLKQLLIREIENYVGYKQGEWWWDSEIGVEYPNAISVYNPDFLNGRWIFRVEKEGREINSRSGVL